jgi:dsRNA-gated channel SID-1-like protein
MVFGEFKCKWNYMQVFLYFILASGFIVASGYYFLKNLPVWTPRGLSIIENDDDKCSWLEPSPFYDEHDAWHMLSAHALFFIFMVRL